VENLGYWKGCRKNFKYKFVWLNSNHLTRNSNFKAIKGAINQFFCSFSLVFMATFEEKTIKFEAFTREKIYAILWSYSFSRWRCPFADVRYYWGVAKCQDSDTYVWEEELHDPTYKDDEGGSGCNYTWELQVDIWLIDSFYFKLIILSPWRKTLQPFKVRIDRPVITNMLKKNQLFIIKNDPIFK